MVNLLLYILEINDPKHYLEGELELEYVGHKTVTEYLAENYVSLNVQLSFITDKSAEGF